MCCRCVRSLLALALLAAWLLAGGAVRGDDDWPRWRGAGFDGTARPAAPVFAAPFELAVRWRRTIGSGYAGIAVSQGLAVTMASHGGDDHLIALDAASGTERWRVALGRTFAGRDGATDGPCSTPTIAGDQVIALGPHGDLVAVALADGAVRWRRQLAVELGAVTPHWGFTTSPLVVGELVVVLTGGEGRAVTAFDLRTGVSRWSTGSDDANYASPMLVDLGGAPRVVVGGDRTLFALDPATGRQLWAYEHGGQGFWSRILNPVRVGVDRLLLTWRPDESVLLAIADQPSPVWTTRELKLNYGTPVFDPDSGLLFGYSGRFLSAVDAATGGLRWRSREPGDGFPILVDRALVVATKRGRIVVADAVGDGYREKAALAVFARQLWTPPSFAYGRIYARDSYQEIAAVDVVPLRAPAPAAPAAAGTRAGVVSAAPSVAASAPTATPSDSRFGRLLRSIAGQPDAAARLDAYLAEQRSFPIVEDERIAHLVYDARTSDVPVTDVAVRGSWLEMTVEQPLEKIAGTEVWTTSVALAPDARVVYQLVRNLGESIVDPKNPQRGDSLTIGGEVSVLYMPRAEMLLPAAGTSLRGRIEELEIESETVQVGRLTWGGKRRLWIYLPPGYDPAASVRYPTLYVLYGEQMRATARLDAVLDRAIGEGSVRPTIAVFVESTSGYEYARTQRQPHRRMLIEQVVPLIDARYRTQAQRDQRFLWGVDEGAVAAIEISLAHPEVFGNAIAQSVFAVGAGDAELRAVVAGASGPRVRFWLDWGRLDPRRQADLQDTAGLTRDLAAQLAARGFTVDSREWNDGSDLVVWGERAIYPLRAILGPVP